MRERGFTLLEVLVSLGLFSIISTSLAASFAHHLKTNNLTERKSAAVMAAQQVMDEVRVQDPATLPSTGRTTQTVTIGNRAFTVVTDYCSETTYCTSANIKHIKITVSFSNQSVYQVSTVYAQLR